MIMELLTDALVQLRNENISLYIFIITLEIEICKPAELVFHLCTIFCLLLTRDSTFHIWSTFYFNHIWSTFYINYHVLGFVLVMSDLSFKSPLIHYALIVILSFRLWLAFLPLQKFPVILFLVSQSVAVTHIFHE